MTHYYTDNIDLKSDRFVFEYYFDNEHFTFTSDNGVFSKNNIDYGSYLLIKNIYKLNLGTNILDLGCGYGPIGIILKKFNNEANIQMVDVNSRAVELSKINCKNNGINNDAFVCDDIETININFDSIVLNPPIRAGKIVIYSLYEKSYLKLNNGGSLYIVIQKKHGAESTIKKLKELFKEVTILDKDSGYFTIQATK